METVEIQLEDRQCPGCHLTFRVSTQSRQVYHNKSCEHFALLRGDLHTKSVVKPGQGKNTVSVAIPTPTTELSKHVKEQQEYHRRRRELEQMQEGAPTIIETEKKRMQEELNTPKPIRKNIMRTVEHTMPETKKDLVPQSRQESAAMIPQLASREVSEISPQEKLQGTNLIGECAEHLFEQMKLLTKNEPDPAVRSRDPYRITVACQCAKEIRELMKLQLEVNKERNKK